MQNIKTNIFGYLKLAAAFLFIYLKLSKGMPLTEEDMMIITALGLGGGSAIVSADAKPKA